MRMQKFPFSMMLDTSNNAGIYKMFLITVHITNMDFGSVLVKFYNINYYDRTGCQYSTGPFSKCR